MSNANKIQVGGNHYKLDGKGEEHWDRVARLGLDYYQACITKYVERCWLKNGIEDLKKAQHFITKYIELMEAIGRKGAMQLVHAQPGGDFAELLRKLDSFLFEGGYGDGRNLWRCKTCRYQFTCDMHQAPFEVHTCSGSAVIDVAGQATTVHQHGGGDDPARSIAASVAP